MLDARDIAPATPLSAHLVPVQMNVDAQHQMAPYSIILELTPILIMELIK